MTRPALHALLNGTAFLLILAGWCAIRGWGPFAGGGRGTDDPAATDRNQEWHKCFMVFALAVSTVFLVSYLQYHAEVGHVAFWGEGAIAVVYGLVLWPHVVLAGLTTPMVVIVALAALQGRFERHRRLARWVLPAWLYVTLSGVAVYVLNFALRPAGS